MQIAMIFSFVPFAKKLDHGKKFDFKYDGKQFMDYGNFLSFFVYNVANLHL